MMTTALQAEQKIQYRGKGSKRKCSRGTLTEGDKTAMSASSKDMSGNRNSN